ncbi:hypothetical protein R1sor_020922 [Riccia sorocarpa]|uniref:CCHC-type domain-containing protein n=1 Tax=Riccia sorocarpa TaxID=122646 RepID=A0ABD3GJ85_9MARC
MARPDLAQTVFASTVLGGSKIWVVGTKLETAGEETMMMEKEYLLNSSREILDRVRDFNHQVSPEERLSERDFPSWKGHSISVKDTNAGSAQKQSKSEASWLAVKSNTSPAYTQHGSDYAQRRGLSPASNLLVVSQHGREISGQYSPPNNPSNDGQYDRDRTWPTLPSIRGGTPQYQASSSADRRGVDQTRSRGPVEKGKSENSAPQGGENVTSTHTKATSEPDTQFEPMGRRNPTWAEVTEQNMKRLDPFARFADIPLVDSVEAGEVEEILDGLITTVTPVENCADVREGDIVNIDPRLLVSTTRYLKETSVVIYTMDLKVSFRYVETWAEQIFKQTLGVKVLSICSLSRNCFYICLDSGLSRNHVFANAPYYMGESMVYNLPWDPRFNPNELRTRSVPIWVELPNVPPNCVSYGLAMMNRLGTMMYASKNLEKQQTNLLKGCILIDISKPMKEEMYFRMPGFGNKLVRQKLQYSGFPDSCFACRQRGHIAANCPNQKDRARGNDPPPGPELGRKNSGKAETVRTPPQKPENDPKKPAPGRKANESKGEFQTVRRKGIRPFKDPKFRTPQFMDNRFGVLREEGEEDDEESDWMADDYLEEGGEEGEEDGEVLPDADEEAGRHDHEGSQAQALERSIDIGSGDKKDELLTSTNGSDDLLSNHGVTCEQDNYMNFEDAERLNARPASQLDLEDSTRLSCASDNRLVFTEGPKKPRSEDEQKGVSKEVSQPDHPGPTNNGKKGNGSNAAKPPAKGR